jgi:hypothetical protein
MPFLFLIFFTLLMGFFKSANFKGKVGEFLVNVNNRVRLDGSIYTKLSDITIRLKDGSTTQIDHIILSKFGIFVIETKNMKGWIFGSEFQKKWTQNIYGKKNSFQNPLLQNYRHIKGLEEFLGIDKGLYSIVTFVGESTFKTAMPMNVFDGGRYVSYIKSFGNEIFSELEVSKMIEILRSQSLLKSRATNKEHVVSLKKASVYSIDLYKSDAKIICRRCNSILVERRNRKTQNLFLGCSSYPRCKHTEVL